MVRDEKPLPAPPVQESPFASTPLEVGRLGVPAKAVRGPLRVEVVQAMTSPVELFNVHAVVIVLLWQSPG
jgi:hypothetical protein